ncbi:MAG: LamG domain-containing protein, partial [Chloroflexus sp.]|uniref:LamG domain-containing protein n=1 Tax=Chloroflexus sp. TaxID=1904827 RepID=UPI003D0D2273
MPLHNSYILCQYTSLLALLSLLVVTFLCRFTSYPAPLQAKGGSSLRFYGSDTNDRDRVKIPLGQIDAAGLLTTSYPVNVGDSFTLEFWMKTALGNTAPACPTGWYTGNIIIDRDVFGAGDYGDYGIAICNQRLVVGISVGSDDRLLIGNTVVTDGLWHHIAIVRSNDGIVQLFVDGQLDGTLNGPAGRIDYRQNRPTSYPTSDPYLVLGAEKHDFPGSRYYDGWIDDMRISRIARYTTSFVRPTVPHAVDDNTIALYRFDEGSGIIIGDSAVGGISVGELKPRIGGAAQHWSNDIPFTTETIPTA